MALQGAPAEACFPPLPRVLAALGTRRPDGGPNFMALGWHTVLSVHSRRYGVMVARDRASHRYLLECPDFTVSFLTWQAADLAEALGSCSGATVDKVRAFQLRLLAPSVGRVPLLADAWLAYECRRREIHEADDATLFVGEVVASYRDPRFFDGGDLTSEALPLIQTGEGLFATLGPRRLAGDAAEPGAAT